MSSHIDPAKAIGFKISKDKKFSYTHRDVILYALGVGVSTTQEDHLKFLYENDENFSVLPTYGVIPAFPALSGAFTGECEGLQVNPTMILHGEQYLELYRPLDSSAELSIDSHVSDVVDKGSGAVIYIDVDIKDEQGRKVAFNQFGTFIQRAGGFGGKRSSEVAKKPVDPPKRAPDASLQETVGVDQPAIYRLSGDYNPLHLDPSFAAMGGFSKPIAHGLCFFGMSARHVLKTYANNDVSKFKAIKVRFSKPVLPGQTIQTDMWKEGSRIHFICKVVETGKLCLTGAYVDLFDANGPSGTADSIGEDKPMCDQIMEEVSRRVSEDPSITAKINNLFLYNIQENDKTHTQWTVDFKNSPPSVYKGAPKNGSPDCTLTLNDENFLALATGQLNGQQAYFQGKVKISGNIMLAQKLEALFKEKSKL